MIIVTVFCNSIHKVYMLFCMLTTEVSSSLANMRSPVKSTNKQTVACHLSALNEKVDCSINQRELFLLCRSYSSYKWSWASSNPGAVKCCTTRTHWSWWQRRPSPDLLYTHHPSLQYGNPHRPIIESEAASLSSREIQGTTSLFGLYTLSMT